MSKALQSSPRRLAPALAAGLASLVVLSALFVATMFLHYRALDFAYFLFALLRIVGISFLVAAAAFAASRHLRSLAGAALLGAVTGLMGGVAFVAAAA